MQTEGITPQSAIQILAMAGHLNQNPHDATEFHKDQIRMLKEHMGRNKGLNNRQRTALARRFNELERQTRDPCETIVTPATIKRWYRRLITKKLKGSRVRGPGRPATRQELIDHILGPVIRNTGIGGLLSYYRRSAASIFHPTSDY